MESWSVLLKSYGRSAFANIRRGNATDRDEIVIEILRALNDFRIIIFYRNEK